MWIPPALGRADRRSNAAIDANIRCRWRAIQAGAIVIEPGLEERCEKSAVRADGGEILNGYFGATTNRASTSR
jgi:hypothetical protein